MLRRRFLASSVFLLALGLSACGGEVDFATHYSAEGLIPEQFLPADTGMVISYSLREDGQFEAVEKLEERLGDAGRLSRTFADQFDASFSDLGLEYTRDLQPAFGEQFRYVYAARMVGSDTSTSTPDTFSVITLSDVESLENVLQVLVDAKQLEEKVVDGQNVYVNNERGFYALIHEDLLLMAGNAEDLVEMTEQDENLWDTDEYQDALEDVGSEQVLYAMLFPAHYLGDLQIPGALNLANVPGIIEHQTLVVRAEEEGLAFQAFVNADKNKAKEMDVSFDQIPREAPYLFEEVPGTDLLAYVESYGFKQSLAEAAKLGNGNASLDGLEDSLRSYLGLDLEEDVLSVFDKGYALALHQNGEGLFPGISVYVDISSDEEKAKTFVDKVDGQLSGLVAVFETSLPGAFVKDTVEIGGDRLSRISMDLSAIPRSADSPLPASVTDSPIELIYGIVDGRLLLSTATVWEDEGESIAESDLYKDLEFRLDDVDEGLILLDAQKIAGFAGNLRALREQLSLQVSEEAMSFEDFLKGFDGFIAKSHSNAYDSVFSGILQLAP